MNRNKFYTRFAKSRQLLGYLSFLFSAIWICGVEASEPPVVVRAFPVEGQVPQLVVMLGNTSHSNITGVKVFLLPTNGAWWTLTTLGAGEWKSHSIALQDSPAKSLVILVEYVQDGAANSITASVQIPESPRKFWIGVGGLFSGLAPVALGAGLSLLGVFLTSIFNQRKEQLSARLQWRRFLFEQYDAQYREFLTRCAGTLDLHALQNHFKLLNDAALVPSSVQERIRSGLADVRNSGTPEQRRTARDIFLDDIRSALLEPFDS
jgi:hypothetical protein